MDKFANQDHHLITIYGDTDQGRVNTLVSAITPEKDIRILAPKEEEILFQAAQNSSLIIVVLQNGQDPAVRLAKTLKDDRMVVSDVIAVVIDGNGLDVYEVMAKGFDLCMPFDECTELSFKSIIKQRLLQGGDRLSRIIVEEEYRRFSDALSCAPTSVMVFDQDKRIVFISEHYYRAYPQSARLLKRGLSVFDAFEMMSKEEAIDPKDPLFEKLKQFWYSLSGDLEFTLDTGVSYRIKATTLPHERGTIVTAQNITEYVRQNKELKKALQKLKTRKN